MTQMKSVQWVEYYLGSILLQYRKYVTLTFYIYLDFFLTLIFDLEIDLLLPWFFEEKIDAFKKTNRGISNLWVKFRIEP